MREPSHILASEGNLSYLTSLVSAESNKATSKPLSSAITKHQEFDQDKTLKQGHWNWKEVVKLAEEVSSSHSWLSSSDKIV